MTKSERRRLKRLKRKEEIKKEKYEMLKKKRLKTLLISLITALIVFSFISFFSWLDKQPGKYDDFAKCLSEKGFIMAGTDWCSACKTQKSYFGKSFEYVDYRNCVENVEWCENQGISRYPTWILPEGTKITGAKQLSELSRLSHCDLE